MLKHASQIGHKARLLSLMRGTFASARIPPDARAKEAANW
jgi:hypothetical protein